MPPTEYDHVASYKRLIDELQLPSDRFIFLDKQPVKEVPLWLKAVVIIVAYKPFVVIKLPGIFVFPELGAPWLFVEKTIGGHPPCVTHL